MQPFNQIVQLVHQTAREFLLGHESLASPYDLDVVSGDKEIAATCCHYIHIAFMTAIPQMNADEDFSQLDLLTEYLSKHNLLKYSLSNFTAHLDNLGNSGDNIRGEFESFIGELRSRPTSYASLLLSQWVKSLTWSSTLWPDSSKIDGGGCIQSALVCASGAGRYQAVEDRKSVV